MKTTYVFVLLSVLSSFLTAPAHAERQITVSFSSATLFVRDLTTPDGEEVTLLETPVVLPKANFYSLPATGTVVRAEMGPPWTPTPTMHRTKPGKYQSYYPPYARGNAMGHCKLTINYDSNSSRLDAVRIHGNAKARDLGRKLSAGCIRIPNHVCSTIVALSNEVPVRVIFEH